MEKKSKTVSMNPTAKKGDEKQQKLSYEQLEQVANSLNQECRRMQMQLQQAQQAIAELNEITTLLEILGKSEYFSANFVARCADKIEELVTNALDASEKKVEETGN